MNDMNELQDTVGRPDLVAAAEFAERVGLTREALRFYADAGLFGPAAVHGPTGAEFYEAGQVEVALLVRSWRARRLSLATIGSLLTVQAPEEFRLFWPRSAAEIATQAAESAASAASEAGASAGPLAPGEVLATLDGPALVAALDDLLAATTEPEAVVRSCGLWVGSHPDALVLRLASGAATVTRSIVPVKPAVGTWAGEFRLASVVGTMTKLANLAKPATAREVQVRQASHGVAIEVGGSELGRWEPAGDGTPYTGWMDSPAGPAASSAARLALELPRFALAVTATRSDRVPVVLDGPRVSVGDQATTGRLLAGPPGPNRRLEFPRRDLAAAVSAMTGPDLLLDLHGPTDGPTDGPCPTATFRSADSGTLTVALPAAPG